MRDPLITGISHADPVLGEGNAASLWLARAKEETEERIAHLDADIEAFEQQLADCRRMRAKSEEELSQITTALGAIL